MWGLLSTLTDLLIAIVIGLVIMGVWSYISHQLWIMSIPRSQRVYDEDGRMNGYMLKPPSKE